MKKNACMIGILFFAALMCGCNSNVPDLTTEQATLITEYATNLLVKHSEISTRTLLSDTELEEGIIEEEKERERKIKEDEIAQAYLNAGIEMVDGATPEEDAENVEGVEYVSPQTISEFLNETNLSIEYSSYELCDSYPSQESTDVYMAMDATPGHQLCVVKFLVQNVTGAEQNFDMITRNGRFRLQTGDGDMVSAQTTMLLDDLSSFRGMIPANGSQQMVLVFEVGNDVSVMNSAKLSIKTDAGEMTVPLN